jgi:hypothetical protein
MSLLIYLAFLWSIVISWIQYLCEKKYSQANQT